MKNIELARTPTGYSIRLVGDAELMAAFGTDTIPLPYTTLMPAKDVEVKVRQSNPDANVYWKRR